MKINKFLAKITLVILIFNILSAIIYNIKAESIQNNIDNNISIDLENNVINQIEDINADIDSNNTTNEITENTISNETINNTIINTTNKETVNNTITDTTIEETNNSINIEDNIIEEEDEEKVEGNPIMLYSEESEELGVTYNTHVQNIGWQEWKQNGEMAGTSGRSLRLEALNIKLQGKDSSNIKIKYQVHIQGIGWQEWKQNGEMAGTSGQSLRLEAIKIYLETTDDYSVMYRTHIQGIGWQNWKTDGEMAGTSGQSLRLEAIEIKIVPKVKKGQIHLETVQDGAIYYNPNTIRISGWKMANVSNTKINAYIDESSTPIDEKLITYTKRNDVLSAIVGYGTEIENPNPGFEFSIDTTKMESGTHTIRIELCTSNNEKIQEITTKINIDRNLHVQYKSHVQNVGWQGYVMDGEMSGTSGKSYRIEAMNISLINAPSNAKIVYRTHVQNIGWQGWKTNGEMAGTSGQSLRIEAIEIKLENMDDHTIEYQVHIQDSGWSSWYIDGETAGTVGQGRRIEAVRIRIVPKYKRQYTGIDVSQFNNNINWEMVKHDGVDFAMIRVGFRGYGQAGNFKEDVYFKLNIESAKQVGIPVGIYFVTQATNDQEAIEEANWVLNKIKGYKLDYPIAIDIEKANTAPGDVARTENLDKNTRTRLAKIFCQTIQNAGYIPIVYTNIDWANNYLIMSELSEFDTWIAHYKYDANLKPNYNGEYAIWQYSDKGIIKGILGYTDLNICYKKY